ARTTAEGWLKTLSAGADPTKLGDASMLPTALPLTTEEGAAALVWRVPVYVIGAVSAFWFVAPTIGVRGGQDGLVPRLRPKWSHRMMWSSNESSRYGNPPLGRLIASAASLVT